MNSIKKPNWATTKKDLGIQFNLVNVYLAVWLFEPFTKGSFFPWKQISFWSSQNPLVLRCPGCLCKARCLRDSKRPHQASPKCNLSTQLTPSFRLVLASHLIWLDVLTSWVAWELQIRAAFNWVSSACRNFNTAFSSNSLFFELSKNIPSPKSSKII